MSDPLLWRVERAAIHAVEVFGLYLIAQFWRFGAALRFPKRLP